jgi:lysophospholipase L1-like esterase
MQLVRLLIRFIPLGVLAAGVVGLWGLYYHFSWPYAALNGNWSLYFYANLFAILMGALFTVFVWLKPARETQFKALLISLSVFMVVLATEFYLRIEKINQAYIETRGGVYRSSYVKRDPNIDWHYLPGSDGYLEAAEYKYPRHHNNLGFSDADFYPKKDSNTILVQTYGDSFTEGDGAPVDSSYPAILRDLLKRDGQTKIIVQNMGICGNDPAFVWKQLKDIGTGLKPDVVVIVYNTGDLKTDFFTRGGQERFKGDYYKGFDAPNWEWIYGVSYVARLVARSVFGIEYKNFFLTDAQADKRVEELKPKWNQTFAGIATLTCPNKTKVLLIKKPERGEVDFNKYEQDFAFFDRMRDTVSCFKQYDLLPFYRDSCHMNRDNTGRYWWMMDGHNNGLGYAMMARGVYNGLRKSYPEIFTTLDSVKTVQQ